jgi:hypothetical protein
MRKPMEMAGDLGAFVGEVVNNQLDMEEEAERLRPEVEKRAAFLEENPAARDQRTIDLWIALLKQQTIQETGDPKYADLYWDKVKAGATVSLTELDTMPVQKRGDFWGQSRAFIMALVKWQANLEAGAMTRGLINGATVGAKSKPLTRDVPREVLRAGMDIKRQIKATRKARANGKNSS